MRTTSRGRPCVVVSNSSLASYLLPQKKAFVYKELRQNSCPEGRMFLPRGSNRSAQRVVCSCPEGRIGLPRGSYARPAGKERLSTGRGKQRCGRELHRFLPRRSNRRPGIARLRVIRLGSRRRSLHLSRPASPRARRAVGLGPMGGDGPAALPTRTFRLGVQQSLEQKVGLSHARPFLVGCHLRFVGCQRLSHVLRVPPRFL